MVLERGSGFGSSLRDLPRHIHGATAGNALIAWLFGVTGPLLIVLNSARLGNLPPATTVAWIFAIYFFTGIGSIVLSLYYRQPVALAYTIPGAVLVGTALGHLTFPEVVGAYLLTGLLVTVLGVTGVVKRVMAWLPTPIMMGMVAGVLMPFGVNAVKSLVQAPVLAGGTFAAFLAVSMFPPLAKKVPPVLVALVTGIILATWQGAAQWDQVTFALATPQLFAPQWSLSAALELVIPLAITVVVVQNGQGLAILQSMGFSGPTNALTVATGGLSILQAFFGGVSACIAGPMTAAIAGPTSGVREGRYATGVILGVAWLIFGLLAPVAATVAGVLPVALINLLGGLALLSALAAAFAEAFGQTLRLSALLSFLVTISGVTVLRIGAPFWGVVVGAAAALVLEREQFIAARRKAAA